jgi:two-component system NarL family response regulator
MNASKKIRVLIADDHPVVLNGLAALLSRRPDMRLVGEANNGKQAVELFFAQQPDVALLDQRMPEMDGVTALETIRQTHADARIILLTSFDGSEDIYRGVRAGARAYLLKDSSRDELLQCIRDVHAGKTRIPETVAVRLVNRLARKDLTSRETDVLRLLTSGKTNKEIAAILNVSENTIKAHVNHVLRKLNVAGRTEATAVALRRGIVHSEPHR